MGKLPAWQLYTGDWLKDPNLSMCSPSTRGIWIDILCAMHENNRSGVIAGTPDQLARLCRCSAVDLVSAIAELSDTKTANVTERHGIVTLICRRMQREAQVRNQSRVRQKKRREKEPPEKACHGGVAPLSQDHSYSYSPSENSNQEKSKPKKKVSIPPDIAEVEAYCRERGSLVDPQKWWDFYESKGWFIGKNKMKDWKAAVRTWERTQTQNTGRKTCDRCGKQWIQGQGFQCRCGGQFK